MVGWYVCVCWSVSLLLPAGAKIDLQGKDGVLVCHPCMRQAARLQDDGKEDSYISLIHLVSTSMKHAGLM